MSPCGVTTSSPRHRSRALPKRSTCVPPALVPRLPPMVHEPSAARLSGNQKPAACACSCTVCKIQPASTVIVRLATSTLRTVFRRCRLSTICRPDSSGVEPTTRPVLPPCGTMPRPLSGCCVKKLAQALTTCATSSVLAGRTTASALPRLRLRQSWVQALSSPSVSTWALPTMVLSSDEQGLHGWMRQGRWCQRADLAASAAFLSRSRTCSAQAVNRIRHRATSTIARELPGALSL